MAKAMMKSAHSRLPCSTDFVAQIRWFHVGSPFESVPKRLLSLDTGTCVTGNKIEHPASLQQGPDSGVAEGTFLLASLPFNR